MSTTQLQLEQRLSRDFLGDYIREAVTTNLATNTSVISTHLPKYRSTADYFGGANAEWNIYIEDLNNAGVDRKVSDDDGTNTLTIRGANLAADSSAATFRLYRISYTDKVQAINDALREVYPHLFVPLDDMTLIYGNILPNSSFEDWASSSVPDKYTLSSVTAAETTTATLIRGQAGTSSCKVTASAGNGYLYITSYDYPMLLDLAGQTVDFRCWVNPEVANDASIVIYTVKADGTAQTLTSTTTCPAGKWTLLNLESQSINSDIVEIQFRFKITTNAKYAYFDDARVIGFPVHEYLLPTDAYNGDVRQVQIQTSSQATYASDDLWPYHWQDVNEKTIVQHASENYLRIDYPYSEETRLRIVGVKPIPVLSSSAGTVTIPDESINLLLMKAANLVSERFKGVLASLDRDRYGRDTNYWEERYQQNLNKLSMSKPPMTLRWA